MGLLTIDNGQLTLQPELLSIPVFSAIWNKDTSQGHSTAIKQLSYIYFMVDTTSPFRQYPMMETKAVSENIEEDIVLHTRNDRVVEALGEENFKMTKDVLDAMMMYEEMHTTYSLKLLNDAESAVHKLRAYFQEVDLLRLNEKDQPIYKASDLINNLKSLGGVIKGIKELRDEVEKEQIEKIRIRGGAMVNTKYEVPKRQ